MLSADLRPVAINVYQSAGLQRVLGEIVGDAEPLELRYTDQPVAGSVLVVEGGDVVLAVLPPRPGPFSRDFRFQHAGGMTRWHEQHARMFTHGRADFRFDLQWSGALMFAPDEMPAGSCQPFALDPDTFGAHQSVCWREEA